MQKTFTLVILSFLCFCTTVYAEDKPLVYVAIPPMAFLMEAIAGDQMEIRSLVSSSDNAELYEPGPKQLQSLSEAVLYFPIGMAFEDKWLPVIKENNPDIVVANCCLDLMREFDDYKHEHSHDHHAKDPHIWTDPLLNRDIALRMLDGLIALKPDSETVFTENYKRLDKQLASLHEEILSLLANSEDRFFIVSHPAWSYFSERYGFKQVPLEYDGKEIGAKATVELIQFAREKNVKRIFVQKQFKSSAAQALSKEINAEIIELNPLAKDHLTNLLLSASLISGH